MVERFWMDLTSTWCLTCKSLTLYFLILRPSLAFVFKWFLPFLFLFLALPYFYNNTHVTVNALGTSVMITWNSWNPTIDYGTGPIDHCNIYYWEHNDLDSSTTFVNSTRSSVVISNLLPEVILQFYNSSNQVSWWCIFGGSEKSQHHGNYYVWKYAR